MFPDLATEHKLDFLPFLLDGVAMKKELNQADGIHPVGAEGKEEGAFFSAAEAQ